jgi:hypothetical protein
VTSKIEHGTMEDSTFIHPTHADQDKKKEEQKQEQNEGPME